jgi:release factor glutamine methyltransferase
MLTTELARTLSRYLSSSGYRMFHSAFGDGNHEFRQWREHLEKLENPLRGLVELFLLQRSVAAERARAILPRGIFEALVAEGVLLVTGEEVQTPGLLLISFRSLIFFHEYTQRCGIYFGADSVALGVYQQPAYMGRTLDLCSGTSIQAMIAAQHGSEAFAVEINPRAARLAALNLRLNNLHERVRIINQPLEKFASQVRESFDLITFNPPLLPVPECIDYPFVGDGGADALDVTRSALALYLPHLAPGGAMEFIGCGMGRGRTPIFVDELSALAGEHDSLGIIQLLKRYDMRRGDAFYDSLVETAALNSKLSADLADAVYDEHFRRLNYDELYTFFMRIEKKSVSDFKFDSPVRITNISEEGNCWFHA